MLRQARLDGACLAITSVPAVSSAAPTRRRRRVEAGSCAASSPRLHQRPARNALAVARGATDAAAAAATATATVAAPSTSTGAPPLQELNKDDFQPFLDSTDQLVVVDFYTTWCGPCKVMLPMLQDMAQEMAGKVRIVKFNCNQENKELAKALGIKVAPTFHLYRNGEKVADMTGAKIDKLRALIQGQLAPQEAADGQN